MGRIIAIANQKGGVGKSTTTINLSACLAEKGKKVLAIDLDPQGNTTSGYGVDKIKVKDTVYQLIIGVSRLDECIQKNILPNLSLISSNFDLAGAEIELIMESMQDHQTELEKIFYNMKEYMGKAKDEYDGEGLPNFSIILSNFDKAIQEINVIMKSIQSHQMQLDRIFVKLKDHIESIRDEYDFIIIDCPPSLGLLTGNAMAVADTVLVPIQCEYYALEGLSQVIDTTNRIKKWLNPKLEIEGVVFTMFDSRTNLSLQVVENVKENLDYNIYKTIIPKNVRLAEAPSHGLPINLYDSKSAGAEGYRNLADEVIERGE